MRTEGKESTTGCPASLHTDTIPFQYKAKTELKVAAGAQKCMRSQGRAKSLYLIF